MEKYIAIWRAAYYISAISSWCAIHLITHLLGIILDEGIQSVRYKPIWYPGISDMYPTYKMISHVVIRPSRGGYPIHIILRPVGIWTLAAVV